MYRTYFHISQSYSVRESTVYKTVKWIKDTLIKHSDFALPGRKALLKGDMEKDGFLCFYYYNKHFFYLIESKKYLDCFFESFMTKKL